ncbi:hypothetical protein [Paracoccus sanguinis]|uniref:hypothetical protein n=1 Tax=Paracoccus sanguinis TaxID=1545044 RepID=UPI0012E028A9|nr:hypothetical protein [Paracoccus sanguinis]
MTRSISDIDAAIAEIETICSGLMRLSDNLKRLRAAMAHKAIADLPDCDLPVTEHRRLHRSGAVPKIEHDPEMQSFILARVDRMTYQKIADAIAEHFPKDRHVHRATVHRWVKKRERALSAQPRDRLR